jgi:hypothetical protein
VLDFEKNLGDGMMEGEGGLVYIHRFAFVPRKGMTEKLRSIAGIEKHSGIKKHSGIP